MKIKGLIIFSLLFFVFSSSAYADTLILQKIGALNTQGKKYNRWYYEPQKVTFSGTASKGANVDVTLDGQFSTVKAGVSDGSWMFSPKNDLQKADHSVVVASGDESYSFILTIGSSSSGAAQLGNGGTLPETGYMIPLIGIGLLASYLIYLGLKKNVSEV